MINNFEILTANLDLKFHSTNIKIYKHSKLKKKKTRFSLKIVCTL